MYARRTIVCGGRNYQNRDHVFHMLDVIHAQNPIGLVIEGGASGTDRFAREWARERNIKCHTEHAQWSLYGKAAGPIRNQQMLSLDPEMIVCFPGGKGTADMRQAALKTGTTVIDVDDLSTVYTTTWCVS